MVRASSVLATIIIPCLDTVGRHLNPTTASVPLPRCFGFQACVRHQSRVFLPQGIHFQSLTMGVIKGSSHIFHFFFFRGYSGITIPYLLDVGNETGQKLLITCRWRGHAWVAIPLCPAMVIVNLCVQQPESWEMAASWAPSNLHWTCSVNGNKPLLWYVTKIWGLSLKHNEPALNAMPPNQAWNKYGSTPYTHLGLGKGGNSVFLHVCLPSTTASS